MREPYVFHERPSASALAGARWVAAGEVVDVLPVVFHELLKLRRALPRLRAGVRDGTTEPDIVANEVHAVRIRLQILDVSLLHLEMPVHVAPVVRLVPFRHSA